MDTYTLERPADCTKQTRSTAVEVKPINLALQGGGAHGAFTWGVLDRLLEDERIAFEGVSASGAGALNAAMLAYGLAEGRREGARKALNGFWLRVSHAAAMGPWQPSPIDRAMHSHALDYSPAFVMLDFMSRVLSPHQLNPANFNPLEHVLEQSIDFGRLRERAAVKLFLSATNVRSGKVKVFTNKEITAKAVMASACSPFLFQAVEIDGEAYWDGGYMGNSALYPLIDHCDCQDVLVVHVNPLGRQEVPRSPAEIMNRVNEISFNSSLTRAIACVARPIDEGRICDRPLKRMNVHAIVADAVMQKLPVMSKLNADWGFLTHLRDNGREFASGWLDGNVARVGWESTIDVHDRY